MLALSPGTLILLVKQDTQLLAGGAQCACCVLQELLKGPAELLTQKDHCGCPSGPAGPFPMVMAQECLLQHQVLSPNLLQYLAKFTGAHIFCIHFKLQEGNASFLPAKPKGLANSNLAMVISPKI